MKNIILISLTLIFLFFQSCKSKFIFNPKNEIDSNKKLIVETIIKELKIDTNDVDFYVFLNSLERNEDIIKYIEQINILENSKGPFVFTLGEELNGNFTHKDKSSICISTSLPIVDISNNIIYILVGTSLYTSKNWIGYNEYFFIFSRIKKDRMIFVNRFENLKQTNVGPPSNLPDLKRMDSLNLSQKWQNVDSILKYNQNKIPDSIKLKMGIKSY